MLRTKTKGSAVALTSPASAERLRYFERLQDRMVESIRELVEIESPSDNKPAVDRIVAYLAPKFEMLGGQARFHRSNDFGDSLQIDFESRPRIAESQAGSATRTLRYCLSAGDARYDAVQS